MMTLDDAVDLVLTHSFMESKETYLSKSTSDHDWCPRGCVLGVNKCKCRKTYIGTRHAKSYEILVTEGNVKSAVAKLL